MSDNTVKTEFTDYDNNIESHGVEKISGNNIESVEISYDRGRIIVYVNGEEIFKDFSGASDFSFTLKRD